MPEIEKKNELCQYVTHNVATGTPFWWDAYISFGKITQNADVTNMDATLNMVYTQNWTD